MKLPGGDIHFNSAHPLQMLLMLDCPTSQTLTDILTTYSIETFRQLIDSKNTFTPEEDRRVILSPYSCESSSTLQNPKRRMYLWRMPYCASSIPPLWKIMISSPSSRLMRSVLAQYTLVRRIVLLVNIKTQ
jgi:hypothetical protein